MRHKTLLGTLGVLILLAATTLTCRTSHAAPFAFLTLSESDVVSKLDLPTNEATNIPVGNRPIGIAISPDGSRAYVLNFDSSNISVIDTAAATNIGTIPLTGAQPLGIVVTPDGARLYVANTQSLFVSVVDTAAGAEVLTIPMTSGPHFVAINPAGTRVYVSKFNGRVAVIDTATNVVVADILLPSGAPPYDIAVSPDGSRVYSAAFLGPLVYVIDATTNLSAGTIAVSGGADQLRLSPGGETLYVGMWPADAVSVVDTASSAEIDTIPVGDGPEGLDITPDGTRLYVNNHGTETISVVDTASNNVVATVPVLGARPMSYGDFITTGASVPTTTTSTSSTTTTSATSTTLPDFDSGTLDCQKAIGKSFKRFGAKAHLFISGCLDNILGAVAAGGQPADAVQACTRAIDLVQPTSRLSRARGAVRGTILDRCVAATVASLGNTCSPSAATMAEVADCVLGEQLHAAMRAASAEYGAACSLLQAVGLAQFPPVCPSL
jgi:YVTN family beta-propeller protein